MDPVSALGVASAIITFLDFAWGLVTGAVETYRFPDGTVDDNARIKVINDLKRVSRGLDERFQDNTNAEKQIKEIAQADEQSGFSGQLKSIRNSCEDLRVEYLKQLDTLRDDLTSAIQARNQRTGEIVALIQIIRTKSREVTLQHRVLRQLIFEGIHSRNAQIYVAKDDTCGWIFGDKSLNGLHEDLAKALNDKSAARWLELEKDLSEHRRNKTSQEFLDWLQRGRDILHISGNAGSGKSTLMKFLAHHSRTREELEKWAGNKTLVLADFYFWNSGTKMQMTLPGLYRSILFEVLSHCPELTQEVFRSQWRRLSETTGDTIVESTLFGEERIEEAFEVLIQKGRHARHRFCFFIDGLDECDGNRLVHEQLAQRLKTWTEGGDVKICASSRPYREFLECLAFPENPTIQLHQINQFDIFVYCLNRFRDDRETRQTRLPYMELLDEIARNSQGVFLWAHLVIEIILVGIRQADPLDVLQKKLKEIPRELDALYAKLREPIEKSKVDKKRSNKMLLLAINNPTGRDLDAIVFSWFNKSDASGGDLEDPDFPHTNNIYQYSEEDALKRIHVVEKQINTLTRGFLELDPFVPLSKGRSFLQPYVRRQPVRFSHRTARDFFLHSHARMAGLRESFERFTESHPYARLFLAELMFGFKGLSWLQYREIFEQLAPLPGLNVEIIHSFESAIQLLCPDHLVSLTVIPNYSTYHTHIDFCLSMIGVEVEDLRQEASDPHRLLRAIQMKNWQSAKTIIECGVPLDHRIRVRPYEKTFSLTSVSEWPLWTIAAIFAIYHQLSNHDYISSANDVTRLLYRHAVRSGVDGGFKLSLDLVGSALEDTSVKARLISFGAMMNIITCLGIQVQENGEAESEMFIQIQDVAMSELLYNACMRNKYLILNVGFWKGDKINFGYTHRYSGSSAGVRWRNFVRSSRRFNI
ncbi:hypothetical protein F5Y13DRAFT_196189 [Hypoxylon sp. FL1857]|nr:hypothetical protein F5Y13DRAFT_196189 [Hypoxylon sp. FL1857]